MPNLTQIAYLALRDLGELRPGQSTSADVMADILSQANELLDEWALERLFVYVGGGPWIVLSSFPDLTTSYTFAPGYLKLIHKNLAVKIAPMMKIYFKIADPMLSEVGSEAAAAKAALRGVGIVGVV